MQNQGRGRGRGHFGPPPRVGQQFPLPRPVQAASGIPSNQIPTHYSYQRPTYHQQYDQHYSQSPYSPAGPAPPPPLFPPATPPPSLGQYAGNPGVSSYPLPPPPPFIRNQESSSQHSNIAGVLASQSNIQSPADNVTSNRVRDLRRRNSGDRDPRLRRHEDTADRRNEERVENRSQPTSSSNNVMEPHMANIRAAVDKVLGLGIRKDIFALPDENDLVDNSDKQQEVDNRFAFANIDAEVPPHNIAPYPAPVTAQMQFTPETQNFAEVDSVAAEFGIPTERNSIEELETKCDKKMLAEMMVRCNFCPEPGMINIAEKLVHQGQHQAAFFKCAACSGKRKFETFAELVEHIHSLHQVTDSEMVLETIILPTVENGLKLFKCGVKNCGKEFAALPERALLSHMEIVHGAYYIKIGQGKYLLRQCRICGDVMQFSSDQELNKHIAEGHPSNQFGEQFDSDGEDVQETPSDGIQIKQEQPDPDIEELSSNIVAAPRPLPPTVADPSSSSLAAVAGPSSSQPPAATSPGPSGTKKKKDKKSKRQQSSSSDSDSSSSDEEYERKRKKRKKKAQAKKLKLSKEEKKWKKKIKSFTPEELMDYLKDMKTKKKLLKDKEKISNKTVSYAPDPKAKFLETLNGKPTHFYCLICSIYTGKLSTWMDHRASYQHVEMYSHTKELAVKRFDCGDIDVQECVIGEKKFTVEPSSQCRECLQIFWNKEEIKTHLDMEDGKCLKLKMQRLEEEAKALSPARSPSPNIIWKPLPKPEDIKGKKWRPVGQDETRRVYVKSPSPEPKKIRVTEVNIPKYMLDGKTAYYVCKLCKVPVGTIINWMEHKQSLEHRAKYKNASITEKMSEMWISHSTSVLHMFGDECNKCLACDANFRTNNVLETHEQTEAHRAATKRKELVDRNEVKNYGSNLSTLYYCDVCAVTTSDNPRDHLGTEEHVNRLNQTSKCQYCPRRIDKGIRFVKHQEEFHPDNVFACKKCPSKFPEGGVLLEHAYIHLNRMIHSYDELLALNMFTIPSDLRKMECGSCPDVFIGQDVSDVTDHMLLYHPDIQQSNMAREIEYSCLFCTQNFFNENQMYDHVKNRHKISFDKGSKSSSESPSPLKKRVFSETPSSSPGGLQEKLLGLSGTPSKPTPPRASSSRPAPPAPPAPRVAPVRRPPSNVPWSPTRRSSTRSLSSSRSRSRSPSRRRSRSRTPPRRKSRSPPRRFSRSRSRSPRSRRRSRTPSRRRKSSIDYKRGGRLAGWRSPSPRSRRRSRTPPKKIEVIGASSGVVVEELTKEQREEQVREESRLLNNLKKNLVAKKATLEDDLRDKLECKKIKMLDSRNDCVKSEKLEGQAAIICPFCVKECKSDEDLMNHMKLRHRDDMFGCSKCARGSQPAVAWSIEVLLQHLANHHQLNVTIAEAISSYVNIPGNLHRINCKLCLPPYLLGTEGFWVGSDLQQNMEHIETHFENVHGLKDKSQVVSKLELACRGCDASFGHTGRVEWLLHLKKNHERLNRPDKVVSGPTKRCDYCGDNIVQTETIRHIKECHRQETFQCKACLEADPACFPYSDSIKEMMQHMVMKHGDQFSSYYDHMVYPVTLYGSLCSGDKCGDRGMVTAFDAATIGKHLRGHQESGGNEVGLFYCRCCDRIKEKFKSIDEVKNHIAQRHKSIVKWKAVNGNS